MKQMDFTVRLIDSVKIYDKIKDSIFGDIFTIRKDNVDIDYILKIDEYDNDAILENVNDETEIWSYNSTIDKMIQDLILTYIRGTCDKIERNIR